MATHASLIACSALLTPLLLSSCASAPPPVANSTQETAKPAQETPKPIKKFYLGLNDLQKSSIKMCDGDFRWANSVISRRNNGDSLDDVIKTLDTISAESKINECVMRNMRSIAVAIYQSENPARTAAELRRNCLIGYGLGKCFEGVCA